MSHFLQEMIYQREVYQKKNLASKQFTYLQNEMARSTHSFILNLKVFLGITLVLVLICSITFIYYTLIDYNVNAVPPLKQIAFLRQAIGIFCLIYFSVIVAGYLLLLFPYASKLKWYLKLCNSSQLKTQIVDKPLTMKSSHNPTKAIISSLDDERLKMSVLLHEHLAQKLVATKYHLHAIDFDRIEEAKNKVNKIETFINEILQEVKQLSTRLQPMELQDFGLISSINKLIKLLKASHQIDISFEHSCHHSRLKQEMEIPLYNTIQDCLEFLLSISQVGNIHILLKKEYKFIATILNFETKENFTLEIPTEINADQPEYVLLQTAKERVHILEGNLDFHRLNKKNYQISIQIPIM